MRTVVFFLLSWGCACRLATASERTETVLSGGRQVHYEVFESAGASDKVLILLHGSSGPGMPLPRAQAAYFAHHGYTTYLLHFFDAGSSSMPSDANYRAWAGALADLVKTVGASTPGGQRPVYVAGYSLGASVALAAGSQKLPVRAIAEFYGSLPDAFFHTFQGMPPLLILHGARDGNIPVVNAQQLERLCGIRHLECASHIYPDEAHGFSDAAQKDADERALRFFAEHADAADAAPPVLTHP